VEGAARKGTRDLSIHRGAAAAVQVAAPSSGADGRSSARREISRNAFAAAHGLPGHRDIFIDHIGEAPDATLGEEARATTAAVPNYRWPGGHSHEAVRRRIQRAPLPTHASRIGGGAHVIMDAVTRDTPVLASAVDGDIGMPGAEYADYNACDAAEALATLLLHCQESVGVHGSGGQRESPYQRLMAQCRQRASLFVPERERVELRRRVDDLLVDGCGERTECNR